jgi:hypothetical protein
MSFCAGGQGRKAPWGHAPLRGQIVGERYLQNKNGRLELETLEKYHRIKKF